MSRYQEGCLYREKRKAGPDVWVFRYRDGQANRKEIVGTVEQFPTRKAAMKACESLRANINRETRSPRTVAELVTHYTAMELPNKTPYTAEVYAGYLKTWIQPKWEGFSLSDVRTVAVETWLKSRCHWRTAPRRNYGTSCTPFTITRCAGSFSTATRSHLCGSQPSGRESPMC